nr:tape measure protein [Vagococcus proximus]
MSDGRVVIDVELNSSKAEGQLDSFGNSADKQIGGKVHQAGTKGSLGVKKIAGALGLVKVASKAIDMVKDSIHGAFERLDTMDAFKRTIGEITGDSGAAGKALDVLKGATKGTAYGLDTAAKATQNFVTRGMDLGDATKSVGTWGDAVAFYGHGTNEELAGVTDAIGKMKTKGKVDMGQLDRLFDVGIDAVGMYATAHKMSSSEVQDALSKGTISADDFFDSVEKGMETGAGGIRKIAGAAKEAGSSWSGTFANMGAAVTRGVTTIIQNLDKGFGEAGLGSIKENISKIGEVFEKTLTKVSDYIPPTLKVVGELVNKLKEFAPVLVTVATGFLAFQGISKGLDVFDKVTKGIGTVKKGVGEFKSIMSGATEATTLMSKAQEVLNLVMDANVFVVIAAAVIALVAGLIYLWKTNEGFRDAVKAIWEGIKNLIKGVVDSIVGFWDGLKEATSIAWDAIKEFVKGAVDGLVSAWESFQETLSALWTSISDLAIEGWNLIVEGIKAIVTPFITEFMAIFNGAKDGLSLIWQGIGDIAQGAWELIKNIILAPVLLLIDLVTGDFEGMKSHIDQIWTNIKNAASKIWTGIKALVSGIIKAFVGAVKGYFTVLKTESIAIWNGLKSGISTIVSGFVSAIKSFFSNLKQGIISIFNSIKDTTSSIWNGIKNSVSGIVERMVNTIKGAWEKAKTWTSNTWASIKKKILSIGDINLKSIGADIINGLISGISGAVKGLWSTLGGIVSGIKNKIKDALHIHSPSHWMRDMIGKNMMSGWGIGLERYSKLPSKAMSTVIEKVKQPLLDSNHMLLKQDAGSLKNSILTKGSQEKTVSPKVITQNFKGFFDGAVFNWSGKEDIRKTMEEMRWLIETEGGFVNE